MAKHVSIGLNQIKVDTNYFLLYWIIIIMSFRSFAKWIWLTCRLNLVTDSKRKLCNYTLCYDSFSRNSLRTLLTRVLNLNNRFCLLKMNNRDLSQNWVKTIKFAQRKIDRINDVGNIGVHLLEANMMMIRSYEF